MQQPIQRANGQNCENGQKNPLKQRLADCGSRKKLSLWPIFYGLGVKKCFTFLFIYFLIKKVCFRGHYSVYMTYFIV